MKKFVKFDIFVSHDLDKPLLAVSPNFSFCFDYDDDVDTEFSEFCDKRYYVEHLVCTFRKLGCKSFCEITEKFRPEII